MGLKHFLTILILFASVMASGQTVDELSDGYVKSSDVSQATSPLPVMPTDTIPPKKVTFGLTAGTGFSYSSFFGSSMSTFVAPHISYQVTPKFSVNAGVRLQVNSLSNTFFYPFGEGNKVTFYRPATQTFLYTEGVYQLNPKVKLSGSLYTSINTFDAPGLKSSSYSMNTYGSSMGIEYKIGTRSTFSAEIQVSRGPGSPRHDTFNLFPSPKTTTAWHPSGSFVSFSDRVLSSL